MQTIQDIGTLVTLHANLIMKLEVNIDINETDPQAVREELLRSPGVTPADVDSYFHLRLCLGNIIKSQPQEVQDRVRDHVFGCGGVVPFLVRCHF